ncbi:MAG TPA: signal peptidase II [Pyrinomonadaceae bacterium]|nr:signal peptidase II [Pyrinomonadaceae bacterium]
MKDDRRMGEWGWRAAYLLMACGIYLADQTTKAWVVGALKLGRVVTVVERFIYLSYAENSGIAFGQLQEGGAFGRWFLAGLATLAAVGVIIYFLRTPRTDDRVLGACALLLAGILGNLTDRVRFGYVVDFIEVHLGSYQWPTFNVADAAICTGAALLALDLLLESKKSGVKSLKSEVNRPHTESDAQ